MRHRFGRLVLTGLALAALVVALRADFANFFAWRGHTELRAGNFMAAQAAFRRSYRLGQDSAPTRFNLALTLYNLNEFEEARRQFEAVLVTAGPELTAATFYNRGNALYRLAERQVAQNPQAASRLWRAAIADYAEALAQDPHATDARSNLDLARMQLTALGKARDQERDGRNQGSAEKTRSGESPAGGTPQSEARQQDAAAGRHESMTPDGGRPTQDNAEQPTAGGHSRRDMSRSEAERLLNDARGRDRLFGLPLNVNSTAQMAKPEKDW
jgi:tetratricopeptide (TPR) repeat protein